MKLKKDFKILNKISIDYMEIKTLFFIDTDPVQM